ncbi:unnamed protein product [Cuscuta europaea]|uniref:Reverse transcriptase zinc-binding domain-containing protein n=1 Tax=Cuscuta europaea TaxID=41803 RepID=A0A9P0ZW23_CUSEU|nr:unnamed protein product [Cuscuta europaea]
MSKAYDRMSWSFLEKIMGRMGFEASWIGLIMECISTVSYHVQFEKGALGPIIPGRGLRQGDPLSPYLFILVAEGLSSLLRRADSRCDVHGVAVCRGAPKVLDGTIPTVDKLRQRGIAIPNGCKLCDDPVESLEHAFRSCRWARPVWQEAGINAEEDKPVEDWLRRGIEMGDEEKKGKFMALLWSLWKRINNAVWKDQKLDTTSVINGAGGMLASWKETQDRGDRQVFNKIKREQWKRPKKYYIKINVDGATNENGGVRAWGWMTRYDEGNFLKAQGGSAAVNWTVAETEAHGLQEAIKGAIREG